MAEGKGTSASSSDPIKLIEIAIPWLGAVLVLVTSAVPIAVFLWGLQPFRDTTTTIEFSVMAAISFTANLMFGGALWLQVRQGRHQASEMNRLRIRLIEWEPIVEEWKRQENAEGRAASPAVGNHEHTHSAEEDAEL